MLWGKHNQNIIWTFYYARARQQQEGPSCNMWDVVGEETADSTRDVQGWLSKPEAELCRSCGNRRGDQRSYTYSEFTGRQGPGGSHWEALEDTTQIHWEWGLNPAWCWWPALSFACLALEEWSAKWQAEARVGGAASRCGLPAIPRSTLMCVCADQVHSPPMGAHCLDCFTLQTFHLYCQLSVTIFFLVLNPHS